MSTLVLKGIRLSATDNATVKIATNKGIRTVPIAQKGSRPALSRVA